MRYAFILLFAVPVFSALTPSSIPRSASRIFVTEGLFEGGSAASANIEGLRFSKHAKEGTERWVFDFSDPKNRVIGKVAPHFQVRYIKADKLDVPQGRDIMLAPPKFVMTFQAIHQNFLNQAKLKHLLLKSQLVKDIVFYPPIEDGDLAIEFVLKQNVLFEPHQPLQGEGRLVLDLKPKK